MSLDSEAHKTAESRNPKSEQKTALCFGTIKSAKRAYGVVISKMSKAYKGGGAESGII